MGRSSVVVERRAQLVRAFQRSLAERGYAGASTAAVAREAGLAPGLVHYYFASKQEMLLEVLRSIRGAVGRRHDERLARAGHAPRARLYALIDALLEYDPSGASAPIQETWTVIAAEAVHQPTVREAYGAALLALVDRIESSLREILRDERRVARDVRSLAAAIVAAVQGVYQMDAVVPGAAKRGSSAPALRQMVAGLIDAQPERRTRRQPKR